MFIRHVITTDESERDDKVEGRQRKKVKQIKKGGAGEWVAVLNPEIKGGFSSPGSRLHLQQQSSTA